MPRSEEISVSLVKSKLYDTTIATLRNEAKELQNAFGSIKVGDSVKALKEQSAASKEVSKAAQEAAKAEREQIKVETQAANNRSANARATINEAKASQAALQEEARTRQQNAKAEREETNARIANIREQKQELSLSKQLNSSHKSLGDTLRSLTLQYISLQRATASLRYAFSEMKDMSDQLAQYRKVTGATVQEMEQIRATAYDIAKSYGESASDVIASAANMARAGYRENSVAMAELATKTKLVGDMTQEAADKFLIAVDAAYKYKGNVEQLSAVLDAANALDNQYATTIEKISDGMTLVASLASTAHVPIEQLMAALGTMTAVTQRIGTETARGLRSIILNVLGDTTTEIEEGVTATEESVKSMTDALLKYGDASVKAAIQAGKVINPMEAIVSLQKAWKENQITEQDLYKISNDVAGKRYYNVFTALIQNPEMYSSMLESIATSLGSAQNEIDILMDSWSKKLEKLKATWTELVNKSITEGFIKDLIDGGTAALEFAGSLENLAVMAGGALVAIHSLSVGIKNLTTANLARALGQNVTGTTSQIFGGLNIGIAAAGIAAAVVGVVKSTYEASQRKIMEEAQKTVESAVASATTYNSLEELTRKYDEIARDGIDVEQGELDKLKTLQSELNGLVGDQATAIDIVNGKYGDTLTALQKLTEKQRQAAINTTRASLSEAVAKYSQYDFNGFWNFGNTTGIESPSESILSSLLADAKYFYGYYGATSDFSGALPYLLGFRKPTGAGGIVNALAEFNRIYEYLGNYTANGELATDGKKSIGEEYPAFFARLSEFKNALESMTSPVQTLSDELDELYYGLEDIGESSGAADDASKAIDDLSDSVSSLTKSIDAATKAKEDFDKAMETTKADAFNDYMEAFNTFTAELNAGRVNSTAMYAAARMMLGESGYNATGGTYAGVMAAMNARGSAGSVLDAYDILNAKYQDENGNIVEGFGVYELLRQSGLFTEGQLSTPDGRYYIPELTDAQLNEISSAFGGILTDVIINALNAFDQYDVGGSATEAGLYDAPHAAQKAAQIAKRKAENEAEAIRRWQESNPVYAAVGDAEAESLARAREEALRAEYLAKLQAFHTAMGQYGSFTQAYREGGFDREADIINPYLYLKFGTTDIPDKSDVSVKEIKDYLLEIFGEPIPQPIDIEADTSEAEDAVKDLIGEINHQSATINIDTAFTETPPPKGNTSTGGKGATSYTYGKPGGGSGVDETRAVLGYASGTRSHPGGLSLVNDGGGAELLVDRGHAYIANGGRPALVNLHRNAKVFTASETRQILGGGVPSYATGTVGDISAQGLIGNITRVTDETGAAGSEGTAEAAAVQAAAATFSSLKDLIDYIIDRIGLAMDEQIEIIDKQIDELKAQREAAEQQNELEEKRQAVADALGNRTVRYIDENGQWHWMADANKVQKAQKALSEYEDELAYKAQVEALEAQKTALQDQYKQITKAWSDIQYAVNTPTGDLYQTLAEVIATGSATDKKGAETVQNLLIAQLLKGGIFSANYDEALSSIEKATAGNPIMPGESESTLASLIATASGAGTGTGAMEAMKAATMGTITGVGASGLADGGTQIINNYFINGVQLGSDQASQPLSSIMRNLTVYTNTGVA